MILTKFLAFSPRLARPTPKRMEKKSTCRISPLAKASTTDVGTMFMRKSTVDIFLALPAKSSTLAISFWLDCILAA